MSSQLFDAQLLGPDDNASHQQLVDLIAAGNFTGRGLPDSAHRYLDAFCNKSNSSGRRRWSGIALVAMMRASASVVQRLKKLPHGPPRIGAIILDREETEERRIIAGLVIRQGLEGGIDFADFWESNKLLDSAPNFPRNSGDEWMSEFQTYLDTLSDLLLSDMNSEAIVLYPISLSTMDGLQWIGRSAVALLEQNALTIVVPDSALTEFRFIDIPLGHIEEMRLQQDLLHESQENASAYRLHNLVMDLQHSSPNYLVNSHDHTTAEFKVSFQCQEDANELRNGLLKIRKTLGTTSDKAANATASKASDFSHHTMRGQRSPGNNPALHSGSRDDSDRLQGTNSTELTDESPMSEHSTQKPSSVQRASQEKGRGKLPSISRAIKQKVARTQRLSSAPTKITKARAAKKTAPVIETSGDEDDGQDPAQDEFDVNSTAQTRTSASNASVRKSRSRRRASAEDEDFIPSGSKAKSTSTKRKRGSSDATEQSRPTTKKPRTKPDTSTGAPTGSEGAQAPKLPTKASAQIASGCSKGSAVSSNSHSDTHTGVNKQHALIDGLLRSKSPGKSAAPSFKKPGQPASTPGRPRAQLVRATPKPTTPHDTRNDFDELPASFSSSTPRSQTIHEEDFGVGYYPVDTEILSSNTKRVPDSPHAESTAISGHADQVDVHREKCIGDMETAKSDPFQQRREGQKITTFTRKLTGESRVDDGVLHEDLLPTPMKSLANEYEVDESVVEAGNQSLPKSSPSLFKRRAQPLFEHGTQRLPAKTYETRDLSTGTQKIRMTKKTLGTTRSLRFEPADSAHALQKTSASTQRNATTNESSSPVVVAAARRDPRADQSLVEEREEVNDSIVSAPPENVEDTLLEAADQQEDDVALHGETTLVGEDMDMPDKHVAKAPGLQFRSSPPIPDSSSFRDASSDDSEADLQASPPTSRADELEWEQSLEPHQRDLHEQLLRTSKHVIRNIVDNETAVTDIAEVFANDGERLLNLLLERQGNESAEAFHDLASKKQDLLNELSDTSRDLKVRRKRVKALE